MLLVLSELAEVSLDELGLLYVIFGYRVGFLLANVRQVEILVDVPLDVGELLRQVLRVALVDDLVVVASLLQLPEVEFVIDVVRVLLGELRQTLLEVRVEWARVDEQPLGEDVLSKPVLGDHTLDRVLEHVLRALLQHVLQRSRLQVSDVASVLVVELLLSLAPCEMLLRRIDNDNVVTMLAGLPRDVVWFVLSTQEVGRQSRDSTQRHPLGVEQVPSLALVLHCTVHRLGLVPRLLVRQSTICERGIDAVHPMPDVGVELDPREFLFGLKWLGLVLHELPHLCLTVDRVVAFFASESRELETLLRLHAVW